MSMLLTISQPAKTEFGGRTTHDFSPHIPLVKPRVSPKPARVDSPVSSLRASTSTDSKMSTPHRGLQGLPPPSAMTLPDPGRPPLPLNHHHHQNLGPMPAPPTQWHGQEDSMRNWLMAKVEEDKRKQEEERTRQENLKLEQRRIEQSILRESLQAGVPPPLVPIIYAGIGGSNMGNISLDWLQQYAAQLQATQQQVQQQPSPELRRETRLIGQGPASYGVSSSQPQVVPSQHSEQPQHQPGSLQTTFSAYQPPPSRPPPTSAPRSATHTQLPRLTTNELHVHQPGQQGTGSAHPLQYTQNVQDQNASSPSIYFHHWVPPNEAKSNMPQTPASKGEPPSAHPGSHLSESDYKESPRKRKAQGPHQAAPPPSAGPQFTSPSFSNTSSTSGRKHIRSRSNTSNRESGDSRPDSRRDYDALRSSQPNSGQLSSGHLSDEQRPRKASSTLQQEDSTGASSTEPPRDSRGERPDSR